MESSLFGDVTGEYCKEGAGRGKEIGSAEFLFPSSCYSGQLKALNDQSKHHCIPDNGIAPCDQFTHGAIGNPSAGLLMMQSLNYSDNVGSNAYLGSVLQPNTGYFPGMLASEFFPVPSNELCISSVKKEAFNVMDDHKEEWMSNSAFQSWINNDLGAQPIFQLESEVTNDEFSSTQLQVVLCKELTNSDVRNIGRIVLPKKEAETCLPTLTERDGIVLQMNDMTLPFTWKFKYRYWPNNKSRMYILENTGDFVRAHCLQSGDSLIIYRNSSSGNFIVRGKKANPEQSPKNLLRCNWKNQFSVTEDNSSYSQTQLKKRNDGRLAAKQRKNIGQGHGPVN